MNKIQLTKQESWQLGTLYKDSWTQEEITKAKQRNKSIK